MSLPGADELFRPTQDNGTAAPDPARDPAAEADADVGPDGRRSSGRVRHDAKMTVYVTDDELVEIEHARLVLRRDHGIAVDRGRLVREAVSIVLGELDERGGESELAQRLAAS